MTRWTIVTAAFIMTVSFITLGCSFPGPSAGFDHELEVAEQRAESGTLAKRDMSRLNAFLSDQRISDEERQRRATRVVEAIIDSADFSWLREFAGVELDGAFGHFPITAVWEFAVRHAAIFFPALTPEESFTIQQENPEQAFGDRSDVQSAIAVLDRYAVSATPEAKLRAEEWARVLRDMIEEYPASPSQ